MIIKLRKTIKYIGFSALAGCSLIFLSCRMLRADVQTLAANIPFNIEVNGDEEDLSAKVPGGFTVAIEAGDNTAGNNVKTPMPEAASYIFYSADEGNFEIEYTIPGDYIYRIYQKAEGTRDAEIDDTVYEATVRVVNTNDGGLEYEIWAYPEKEGEVCEKAKNIVFKNRIFEDTDVKTGDAGSLFLQAAFALGSVSAAVIAVHIIKNRRENDV